MKGKQTMSNQKRGQVPELIRIVQVTPEIVRDLEFLVDRFETAIECTYATRTDRSVIRSARKALDLLDPNRRLRGDG